MRAVQVVTLDGPEQVQLVDVPEPSGDGLVVVDVHAAGAAWPDLLLTRGEYQLKPPPPFTLGAEAAGVVRSAPEGSAFSPGQRVVVLTGVGAWQETLAVPEGSVFPLPDEVSFVAGAGLIFNYLTVHFALLRRGRLEAGRDGAGARRHRGHRRRHPAAGQGLRRPHDRGRLHRGEGRRRQGRRGRRGRARRGLPRAGRRAHRRPRRRRRDGPRRRRPLHRQPALASPPRVGCSWSGSPAGRSPRSRSTGCC